MEVAAVAEQMYSTGATSTPGFDQLLRLREGARTVQKSNHSERKVAGTVVPHAAADRPGGAVPVADVHKSGEPAAGADAESVDDLRLSIGLLRPSHDTHLLDGAHSCVTLVFERARASVRNCDSSS